MQIEVDSTLARIYAGHIEATYIGPGGAWEIDDGAAVRTVPAREVPEACGAEEHVERLQVRRCMRLAVAEVDDPAAAMGEAGPVGGGMPSSSPKAGETGRSGPTSRRRSPGCWSQP